MNRELLTQIAERLEEAQARDDQLLRLNGEFGFKFDMENWAIHSEACGTAGCIAGYAVWLQDPDLFKKAAGGNLGDIEDRAMESLGLSEVYYEHLTQPCGIRPSRWDEITPGIAARCIRHLLETGDVDWPKAFEEEEKSNEA